MQMKQSEFVEHKHFVNNDREKFFKSESSLVDEPDKFATFEKWLLQNGTNLPKLELKDYGDEVRGCHTKEDIHDEEVIIEVPLKCLITVEMGKETEIGRAIIKSRIDLDAPKHIFLMVFMLVDRKDPHSFFKPYYDILPETLNNMPIFWTPEELKYLEGSYLLEQIDERNIAIEADYLAICNVVHEFRDLCTLQEFKWARMCVCSRNFGLVINGLQTAAMVPYADMLNHYRPRETKWQFDEELQGFTVVSLQTIRAGAQVYDSYGRKCNHRFLLNYGFSVENNIEPDGFCPNEVPIFVEMKKTDPLYDVKSTFYRRDLSTPYRRIRVCVSDNENTRLLLAFLRVVEADRDDFDILVSTSGNSLYRSLRDAQQAISIRNETRVMAALLHTLQVLLGAYPTSLEQDTRRLESDEFAPFSNQRHAVIQIRGEKEVLHFYVDFAQTCLSLLKCADVDHFEAALEKVRREKHPVIFVHAKMTLGRLFLDESRRNDSRRRQLDLTKPTVV
eukprot:gene15706-17948_t